MVVETPLLDQIKFPADLRNFEEADLRQIADELRSELIDAVSQTGGHLRKSWRSRINYGNSLRVQ